MQQKNISIEEQIEYKALRIVKQVMKTSSLELQKPNHQAYEKMIIKAKESIRKISKLQI